LKYPPFPWAQNFQDGAHQTTEFLKKGAIFFGHPVLLRQGDEFQIYFEISRGVLTGNWRYWSNVSALPNTPFCFLACNRFFVGRNTSGNEASF